MMRNAIPRPAMLGTLTGVSLTFIVMNPAMETWNVPYIGLITFTIILLGWFGKMKTPFHIPVGLVAIIVGTAIGWLVGYLDIKAVGQSLEQVHFSYPTFSIQRFIDGLHVAAPFLASAIPLGIYNFIETIDNLESAAVAGDHFHTRQALVFDATSTIVACSIGSPFPIAVYIGHPGWKEAGARIGYAWLTGVSVLILTWFGILSFLYSVIPLVAILPILIYIGLVIGAQAFQSSHAKYAPAVILAIIPWLANWGQSIVDTALTSAGTSADEIGFTTIAEAGLLYSGLITLGSGAIIVGMIWASILVFTIDRKFFHASMTCLTGAVLSFFGMIHHATVGWGVAPQMALSYMIIGLGFFLLHKKNEFVK